MIPGVSQARVNFLIALIVLEVIALAMLVALYVLNRIRDKDLKTAYEVNDYDKDPGLDCYYDVSRRPDLEVKEILLYSAVSVRNGDGRSVGQTPVDLY